MTDTDEHERLKPQSWKRLHIHSLEEPQPQGQTVAELALQLSSAQRRIVELERIQHTMLTRLHVLERGHCASSQAQPLTVDEKLLASPRTLSAPNEHTLCRYRVRGNGFELLVHEPQPTEPQNSLSHRLVPPGPQQSRSYATNGKISTARAENGSKEGTSRDSLKNNALTGQVDCTDLEEAVCVKADTRKTRPEQGDKATGSATEECADDELLYDWLECSHNAYGLWIHLATQGGLVKGISAVPMVLASTFVQMVFSLQLLNVHKNDFDKEVQAEQGIDLCMQPILLQMCAMAIFVILMSSNLPGIWRATRICLSATYHKGSNGSAVASLSEECLGDPAQAPVKIQRAVAERIIIFVIGVLSELTVWVMLLVAGLVWINSASNVDLVDAFLYACIK
jgi:hypothetical protein